MYSLWRMELQWDGVQGRPGLTRSQQAAVAAAIQRVAAMRHMSAESASKVGATRIYTLLPVSLPGPPSPLELF